MTEINLSEAQEKFDDLVELLKSKQQDEIILTEDGKPTIKMSFVKKDSAEQKNNSVEQKKTEGKRRFGMAKGKFFYDSDFWEEHDEKYGRIAMF